MSDWRKTAGVEYKDDWRKSAGVKSPIERLASGETKQQLLDGIKGTGIGIPAEDQRSLADFPGMARSALNGVTSNLAPHILAAMEASGDVPFFSSSEEIDAARAKRLPEIQKQYGLATEEHPGSNLIGAIAQPSPLGKFRAAGTAGKLGLAAGRTAYAGGQGALAKRFGAEGPQAQDAGTFDGAALPAGVQALAEGAGPVIGKVARGLRTGAGSMAANAAGLRGGIVNQAKRAGIPSLDKAGEEAIPKLGNEMLDEGLIPFGGSKIAVQRRAEKLMDQAGTAGAAIRTRGDLAGPFSQRAGADAAFERLGARIDPALGGDLQTARAAGRAEDFIRDAEKSPNTFKAADDLKRGAYGSTNWSLEAPEAAKLKRETVSGYRQSMEDQLDALLPGEGKALRAANAKYGLAAQTADFAEEAAGREAASSKFGLGSLMLGAMGGSAGGAFSPGAGLAAGVGLPLASHLLKTRGAAVAAPLLRLGSKASGVAGRNVNQSPAGSAAAGSLLEKYFSGGLTEEERRELEAQQRLAAKGG